MNDPLAPLDLQINGYAGVDFCDAELSAEDLHAACQGLVDDGVDAILLTVITDSIDHLTAKLANVVRLREQDDLIRRMITGFHVEGPFLSAQPGYIGAHDPTAVVPANVDDARKLLDAGDGLIRIVTLAPEHDTGFATTHYLADQSVTVSAGHCNPSLEQLRGAIDHGLNMITHFGNGCPVELPRHDNFLQRVLHLRDQLWIGFIPDGAHIDFAALKNYLDLVGLDRSLMVTDAISAAKLGPGRYELSSMSVEVDEHGVARKPGSANLAGSTITMPAIIENLTKQLGYSAQQVQQLIDLNPRKAIRYES